MDRKEISSLMYQNLVQNKQEIRQQFLSNKEQIGFFYMDDLLSKKVALKIHACFPKTSETVQRKSLREQKFTAFQMNKYDVLLEEVIYAFHEPEIVTLISEICDLEAVYPDENLYAGGLSLMKKGNFLNPHLDNSHDKDRNKWRVLNLLYYVTPDWKLENGGNLEVWPNGLKEAQITIESKFNRLVVMATHQKSWHSVSKVEIENTRCCVSNYYFSDAPLLASDSFHVTTFRGRPNEKVKDYILKIDNSLRSIVRTIFKKGIRENPHKYKK